MSATPTSTDSQTIFLQKAAQREYHKRPAQKVGFLRQWADLGTDAGTLSGAAKLGKSILNILSAFYPLESLKSGAKFLSGISDSIKVMGVGKGINDIKDNIKKPVKVASSVLGLASAGAAFAKVLNAVDVIQLGKATVLLGRIPVVGSYVARYLPILSLFNLIDIAKAGCDIKLQSDKIILLNKETSKIRGKIQKWEQVTTNETLKKVAEAKAPLLEVKQNKSTQLVTNTAVQIKTAQTELAKAEEALEKAEAERAKSRFPKPNLIRNHWKAKADFEQKHNALSKLKTDLAAHTTKLGKLRSTALPDDVTSVDAKLYASKKVEKWNIKLTNTRWNKAKEGLGIALNSVVAVTLVALTILSGLALLSILPISLSISSGFLVVSILGLGIHFINKLWKPKGYSPITPQTFISKATA